MRTFYRQIRIITLILCVCTKLYAQNPDSLDALLKNLPDREKLTLLQNAGAALGNKPYEALEYLNQAIDLALKLNDDDATARSYQLAGRMHYQNGNFAKAKENYSQALQYFIRTNNEKGEAEVNSTLAAMYFAQGNQPAAVESYLKALRYYEQVSNKAGMVNALSNLGNIYLKQNNFSKAIEYHERAIKIYEESSDKFRTLVGADQIGNIYLQKNNFKKASEYFNKSLKLNREINNPTGIAYTLHQLGKIAERMGESDKAISYYKQSMRISEELKTQPMLTVSNLNGMGQAYFDLKQYPEAIKYYQRAIKIATDVGLKFELETAYNGLAEVYGKTKEKSKAQRFETLSTNIKDSLYNDSIYKLMSDKELIYLAEKKQTQIELMAKEQKIKDSELLRERQLRNFFLIASLVMGVIFIVLVLFFIQNKRIAKSLERQKNELQVKNTEIIAQSEQLRQIFFDHFPRSAQQPYYNTTLF